MTQAAESNYRAGDISNPAIPDYGDNSDAAEQLDAPSGLSHGKHVPPILDSSIPSSWGNFNDGGTNGGIDDCFTAVGAMTRKGTVRIRAPPAGPHPYLDRFASGMHRPLEGENVRCNIVHRALYRIEQKQASHRGCCIPGWIT